MIKTGETGGEHAELVYKICPASAWARAVANGVYPGSADDARDGFIHFSTAAQLRGTLDKYFAGQSDLVIVAVASTALGNALKWELSRGGALFPHCYAPLNTDAATWVQPLPLGADGAHMLPGEVI